MSDNEAVEEAVAYNASLVDARRKGHDVSGSLTGSLGQAGRNGHANGPSSASYVGRCIASGHIGGGFSTWLPSVNGNEVAAFSSGSSHKDVSVQTHDGERTGADDGGSDAEVPDAPQPDAPGGTGVGGYGYTESVGDEAQLMVACVAARVPDMVADFYHLKASHHVHHRFTMPESDWSDCLAVRSVRLPQVAPVPIPTRLLCKGLPQFHAYVLSRYGALLPSSDAFPRCQPLKVAIKSLVDQLWQEGWLQHVGVTERPVIPDTVVGAAGHVGVTAGIAARPGVASVQVPGTGIPTSPTVPVAGPRGVDKVDSRAAAARFDEILVGLERLDECFRPPQLSMYKAVGEWEKKARLLQQIHVRQQVFKNRMFCILGPQDGCAELGYMIATMGGKRSPTVVLSDSVVDFTIYLSARHHVAFAVATFFRCPVVHSEFLFEALRLSRAPAYPMRFTFDPLPLGGFRVLRYGKRHKMPLKRTERLINRMGGVVVDETMGEAYSMLLQRVHAASAALSEAYDRRVSDTPSQSASHGSVSSGSQFRAEAVREAMEECGPQLARLSNVVVLVGGESALGADATLRTMARAQELRWFHGTRGRAMRAVAQASSVGGVTGAEVDSGCVTDEMDHMVHPETLEVDLSDGAVEVSGPGIFHACWLSTVNRIHRRPCNPIPWIVSLISLDYRAYALNIRRWMSEYDANLFGRGGVEGSGTSSASTHGGRANALKSSDKEVARNSAVCSSTKEGVHGESMTEDHDAMSGSDTSVVSSDSEVETEGDQMGGDAVPQWIEHLDAAALYDSDEEIMPGPCTSVVDGIGISFGHQSHIQTTLCERYANLSGPLSSLLGLCGVGQDQESGLCNHMDVQECDIDSDIEFGVIREGENGRSGSGSRARKVQTCEAPGGCADGFDNHGLQRFRIWDLVQHARDAMFHIMLYRDIVLAMRYNVFGIGITRIVAKSLNVNLVEHDEATTPILTAKKRRAIEAGLIPQSAISASKYGVHIGSRAHELRIMQDSMEHRTYVAQSIRMQQGGVRPATKEELRACGGLISTIALCQVCDDVDAFKQCCRVVGMDDADETPCTDMHEARMTSVGTVKHVKALVAGILPPHVWSELPARVWTSLEEGPATDLCGPFIDHDVFESHWGTKRVKIDTCDVGNIPLWVSGIKPDTFDGDVDVPSESIVTLPIWFKKRPVSTLPFVTAGVVTEPITTGTVTGRSGVWPRLKRPLMLIEDLRFSSRGHSAASLQQHIRCIGCQGVYHIGCTGIGVEYVQYALAAMRTAPHNLFYKERQVRRHRWRDAGKKGPVLHLDRDLTPREKTRMGWRCVTCCVCAACGLPGDAQQKQLVPCDVCKRLWHVACLGPKSRRAVTVFRCQECAHCSVCGALSPSDDPRSRWVHGNSHCPRCYRHRGGGLVCDRCGVIAGKVPPSVGTLYCSSPGCSRILHDACCTELLDQPEDLQELVNMYNQLQSRGKEALLSTNGVGVYCRQCANRRTKERQ